MIVANLDCEWVMATQGLPQHQTIPRLRGAAKAHLLALAKTMCVLAPGEPVWLPGPSASRGGLVDDVAGPFVHGEIIGKVQAAWATRGTERGGDARCFAISREVNDRRFGHRLRQAWGIALPGSEIVEDIETFAERAAASTFGFASWIAKAPHSASGGLRMKRRFGPLRPEDRVALARRLERFGALIFEPWVERSEDYAIRGFVNRDNVTIDGMHTLFNRGLGAFAQVIVAGETVPTLRRQVAIRVGEALHTRGYRGPYCVDGFSYEHDGKRIDHPFCEVNARYSIGHIAAAWSAFLGSKRLSLSVGERPVNAQLLADHADASVWLVT